jgi:hypothetical protein
MRWISFSGEFAFLSVGSTAQGIVAVGGGAYGIIAIGAFGSVGVISFGMNAVGSVAAFGMNAAAPISISLINGLGVFSAAGVNGWGTWTRAGTNSTGLISDGGVNTDQSFVPTVFVIVILIVVSSVLRGARAPRHPAGTVPFRRFVRSETSAEAAVTARLVSVREDAIELADAAEAAAVTADEPVLAAARALIATGRATPRPVVAHLSRGEESVQEGDEARYRERPRHTKRVVLRCSAVEPAPDSGKWLPRSLAEVQWVIAWTARLSAIVAVLAVVWALT